MKKIQKKAIAAGASAIFITLIVVAFRQFDAWFVSHDPQWRFEATMSMFAWLKRIGIAVWFIWVWYLFYRLCLHLWEKREKKRLSNQQ